MLVQQQRTVKQGLALYACVVRFASCALRYLLGLYGHVVRQVLPTYERELAL